MNQIFGFKPQFKQLIIDGIKTHTTREDTPFRRKCGVGDLMYMFTGVRTKESSKFAVARCIERVVWHTEFSDICPIIPLTWDQFAFREGFSNLEELENFFCKKLITYHFEVVRVIEEST